MDYRIGLTGLYRTFSIILKVKAKPSKLFQLCFSKQDGINGSWMQSYLPLIRIDQTSGQVFQVRFNDFDRDTLSTFHYDDVQTFYECLNAFSKILENEDNKLWMKLPAGKCLIVDNWR